MTDFTPLQSAPGGTPIGVLMAPPGRIAGTTGSLSGAIAAPVRRRAALGGIGFDGPVPRPWPGDDPRHGPCHPPPDRRGLG